VKARVSALAKRLRRSVARETPHWEGVYSSPSQVEESGPGFGGDTWLSMTRNFTVEAIARSSAGTLCELVRSDVQMLAVVCTTFGDAPVRILDFGGGMGIGYVLLRGALSARAKLDYAVLEGERVCEGGESLLRDRSELRFLRELPANGTFDIVYASSSMQYIQELDSLLARFAAYRPRFVLFGDVPAGDVPTFWCAQLTVPGSRIAYSFLSLSSLVDAMAKLGYALVVRGVTERAIHVDNLPATHRVPRTSNLLFQR
jgi:putative methyltransferase (TIGR04325 family)